MSARCGHLQGSLDAFLTADVGKVLGGLVMIFKQAVDADRAWTDVCLLCQKLRGLVQVLDWIHFETFDDRRLGCVCGGHEEP